MATKRRKKSKGKKKLTPRQKLIQSINRSIKYREKKGYIVDPIFKESIQRRRTKTLKAIKENVGFEIGQHSIYIDPLTNASMKGTKARSYIRQQKKIRKIVENEIKQLKYDQFYDLDSDQDYDNLIDTDYLGIIEWLKTNIMNLPDTKYLRGKVVRDYSGQKQTLLNYIDDRLVGATSDGVRAYVGYLKDNEVQLVDSFEVIKFDSKGENVEASFTRIFTLLKGAPVGWEGAEDLEDLNSYYEDFSEF